MYWDHYGMDPCSEFGQGCLIDSVTVFYGTCARTFGDWTQHFSVFPVFPWWAALPLFDWMQWIHVQGSIGVPGSVLHVNQWNDSHLGPCLSETSSKNKPEQEGFEPPEPLGSMVFKTIALSRSATAPKGDHISFGHLNPLDSSRMDLLSKVKTPFLWTVRS